MPDRTPLLPLARLWEKTSSKGTEYMSGRLGLAKVVVLPVREAQADGHTHDLFVTAPMDARKHADAASNTVPAAVQQSSAPLRSYPSQRSNGSTSRKVQIDDDIVPF